MCGQPPIPKSQNAATATARTIFCRQPSVSAESAQPCAPPGAESRTPRPGTRPFKSHTVLSPRFPLLTLFSSRPPGPRGGPGVCVARTRWQRATHLCATQGGPPHSLSSAYRTGSYSEGDALTLQRLRAPRPPLWGPAASHHLPEDEPPVSLAALVHLPLPRLFGPERAPSGLSTFHPPLAPVSDARLARPT